MRVLDGNAGRRPINPDEPIPAGKLEDRPPPDHLNDAQKQIWREAIKSSPAGMLRDLDESVLEVWVVARERHRDAAKIVAQLGSLLKAKDGGAYQNPYLSIMNKQAMLMLKAAAELGFSPSSRSRVKVAPPKGAGGGNPFADLKSLGDD
jgi:P27 family predicted phage terminase small subunit